jgi:hypothetical protein
MSSVHIPSDSSTFADHPEGEPIPCFITSIRESMKGQVIVFRTKYGYAGKSFVGNYARSYADKTCSLFGVKELRDLVKMKAFATFKGNPNFAFDFTPALEVELNERDQHFLKTGEV